MAMVHITVVHTAVIHVCVVHCECIDCIDVKGKDVEEYIKSVDYQNELKLAQCQADTLSLVDAG